MGSIVVSNKSLDKYFGYLKNLDNKAKRNLIIKLIKSIETKHKKDIDLGKIFGAWEDNRNSDQIIAEIKISRVENHNIESFE